MNKIYKVIWSKVRNCYVVVSELAKRNGKCSSSLNKKIIASFLAAGLVTALPTGVEAETFNGGTGSGIGVLSRNNNAWGNRTVVLNYQFFRNGEPVYIIWDNGGDQKFRAIDSNGSAFSSGSTIDQLVNRLRSSEYSTVTWIDLGTKNSTAFGDRTTVSGEGATAFGFYTSATANQATAFGHRTTATANRATAFGIETTASGKNSTSFGYKTQAVGENSTAWGSNTQAVGGGATAFGARTQARAENSVAWGNNSIVSGGRAIVNGVEYTDLEALRYNGDDGDSYYAYYLTGRDSAGKVVRLGGKEDDPDIIEGGYKYAYIKNASGWVDYDANASAINVWYGEDEAARQKIDAWIAKTGAEGGNGAVAGQYSTAFGNSSEVYAKNALGALGGKVEAGAHNSAAIGVTAEVSSKNAYAIGNGVTIGTGSAGSVALGGNGILKYGGTEYDDIIIRKKTHYDNTTHQEIEEYNVIGINSDGSEVQLNATPFTTKDEALADIREKNPDYTSVGEGATNAFAAVGGKVSDNATNAIAMGSKASATLADSVALGSNAVADRAPATNAGHDVLTGNSYAGTGADSPVWKSTLAAVSVGGGEVLVDDGSGNMVTKTATRQITGVAAGSEDTDAVNVAQLKRAAALETDNRNVGLIVNADGKREITSPYIHVEGVEEATAAYQAALAAYLASSEYTSLPDADKPVKLAAKIAELKETLHFAVTKGTNSLAIGYEAQTDTSAKKSGVFGNSSYVSGENSYSIGNSNNIYSNNTVALGNNINTGTGTNYAVAIGDTVFIDSNVSNATVIGYQASASVADSVALGSYSVASRGTDGDAGYDFNTGKASTDITNNAWRPTHAAISIGDDHNVTRQITGVAAGSKDTDAVNVAQLKKTVWNIGLAAEGGTVKNPTDGYSLDVKTTVVGNGKNKVQFVAGKGITLTSKRHTTDSLYDTYGIAISTRFEELETTPDNVATAIYYDGIRYTIASGGSSAPSKVTTDHRALNVESIQLQKLDDDGNPVKDTEGNPVMEEYRSINSPYIHINGLRADPSDPYTGVSVAPEYQANAAGENAIAIGREADALYTNSIAIGHLAEAGHSDKRAVNTVALGYRAHALANNSVSVGTAAFATGNRSIAIGVSNVVDTETLDHNDQRAWAAGQGSMVLGNEARAVSQAIRYNINNTGNAPIDYSTNDAIALGTRADARALNAIALGGNMSYTDDTGKVTYGSPEGNARDFGATVGEGAKSAIAIGGAYGSQKTDSTGAVTGIKSVTYTAATSYGAKGIAIGSGALIANNEDYLDLQRLIDNPDYQDLKKTYNNTRHAFTVAEREYNNYLASLNGNIPTDEEDPIYIKLKDLKGSRDSAKGAYDEATAAFKTKISEKIALEEKNASSVEDAIAIGAGSRTGIIGGIALGSQATAGYLDRSGTESALTGYDMRTKTGYFGSESDDPTWKATHGALSIGTLSTTDPSDRDDNVTRRITNVAAGVFDRDAVNVAQLKRATTFTSDNRNMAIGSDEQGYSKIQSPFAHFEGVAQMSEAISITEYTRNAYITKVDAEKAKITSRITEFQKAIDKLDVRLDGDGTTENIGLRTKLSLVPESNTQLQKNYQQLIKDIEYEKELLSNKITALNKELTNLPSDAGSAYDAAVALVAQQAHAYGTDSIAIGKGSVVGEMKNNVAVAGKGEQSLAIGVNNMVTGNNSIAIGTKLTVSGNNSGAIGDPSVIDGNNSYSIGNNNTIKGAGSADEIKDVFVLGNNVTIDKKDASNSVFLGSNAAYVPADYDTTGGRTTAGNTAYNSMIINNRTYDFAGGDRTAGVVSVGGGTNAETSTPLVTRRIQNVAPGLISAESTDAINGSQLYQAMQALSIEVKADEAKSTKVDVTNNPAPDTTGGGTTGGTTGGGTAGGTTTGGTTGDTTGGTTGGTTTADTTPSIITLTPAVTYEVKASTTELVLGDDADGKTSTQRNLLLKDLKKDEADNDPKSYKYQLDLKKDINLGENGSVTIGNSKMNNDGLTVGDTTVTNDGLTVGDTTVARDRVTVGDTTMNNDGLTVGDTTVARDRVKVGDTNVNSDGVTIAGGPSMTKTGIDAAGSKITNVQAGTDPTDAVNVSQLRDFAAQTNQNITNVDSRARKGVAGAAALAALHPLDFDPDDKLTFAAGVGNYRGETAAAIGAFYRPDEKVMFSIGGSMGNGENVVNAGVSFSLDRTPRVTGSRTALTKEVVQLREQVARQDARLARQDAQIEKLTALVMKLAGNEGMEALSDTVGTAVPMKAPALFPDNLDNKWAYDFLEDLEQRGYIHGYAGRSLTRDEFAAALDRAMAGGAKLDERLIKEFEPELSHVRVVHIEGKGEDEGKSYERPRASHDKLEDKHEIEKKHFRVKEKKVTSKS